MQGLKFPVTHAYHNVDLYMLDMKEWIQIQNTSTCPVRAGDNTHVTWKITGKTFHLQQGRVTLPLCLRLINVRTSPHKASDTPMAVHSRGST